MPAGTAASSRLAGQERDELAHGRIGQAGLDGHGLVALGHVQDLALPVEGRQDVPPAVGDGKFDHVAGAPEVAGDGLQEVVDALAGAGRDNHRARVAKGQLLGLVGSEVGLVEHQQLGDVARPDLAQHGAHGLDLAFGLGRRAVDQVYQQVGFVDHLEGAAEGLDQLVGQLAHETDGVGHEDGLAAGQGEAAGAGVEGGEQAGRRRPRRRPSARLSRVDLPALV